MKYVIGIDPGISGGIALVEKTSDGIFLRGVWDMPTVRVVGGKQRVNAPMLADIISRLPTTALGISEQVGAMPGQGVVSMFNFGRAAGIIEGVAAGAGLDLELVLPVKWKRALDLIGKDKSASRALACEAFPKQANSFARVKDDGRAEAALIALWGHKHREAV